MTHSNTAETIVFCVKCEKYSIAIMLLKYSAWENFIIKKGNVFISFFQQKFF